uniref:Uncharacterized protein n=1 Tax=Desulfacinum infernum TaxID=35837 RepID=A0A832EJQ9_9BACT
MTVGFPPPFTLRVSTRQTAAIPTGFLVHEILLRIELQEDAIIVKGFFHRLAVFITYLLRDTIFFFHALQGLAADILPISDICIHQKVNFKVNFCAFRTSILHLMVQYNLLDGQFSAEVFLNP